MNMTDADSQKEVLAYGRIRVANEWRKVEPFDFSRTIIRCYNCQKYGHFAKKL